MPAGWWHHVVALEKSITFIYDFFNRTNFGDYLTGVFRNLPQLLERSIQLGGVLRIGRIAIVPLELTRKSLDVRLEPVPRLLAFLACHDTTLRQRIIVLTLRRGVFSPSRIAVAMRCRATA